MKAKEKKLPAPEIPEAKEKASCPKKNWLNMFSLPHRIKEDCDRSYTYPMLLLHYAIAFTVIGLVCLVYKLKLPCFAVLCIVDLLGAPALIYYKTRREYEQRLFGDCTRYVEQMLYSFTRKPKILSALEETGMVVTQGRLRDAMKSAQDEIRNGTADADSIYRKALRHIEAVIPNCQRVQNLHEFLGEVELVGGMHNTALDIMLEDLRDWDVRTSQFMAEQKIKKASILGSIVMSLGVCLFMTNLMPKDLGGDISGSVVYQIVTTGFMIICYMFYRFISRKITRSWVSDAKGFDEETVQKDLDTIHT